MSRQAVRHPGELRWETRLLSVVTLTLTAIGIAALYSSASYVSSWYLQAQQQVWAAVGGGVLFLVVSRIDYDVWRRVSRPLLLATMAGLAVLALARIFFPSKSGSPAIVNELFPLANGARRWIRVGIQVQVSEIARFTLTAYLAARAAELGTRVRDLQLGFFPLVGVTGLVTLLVLVEPSMTMSIVLAVIGATVIFTAGARISHMLLPVIPASLAMGAMVLLDSVHMSRLTNLTASTLGCQIKDQWCQSLIGFGNGGVLGVGFGRGTAKLGHLAESISDFLFSSIGEEWGLVGVVVVMLCFGLFCWMGFRIARTARDPFGTYLASGLTMAVGITAVLHAMVVMRLGPTTGLTLPFMSAGRVSLIISLFSAGVLVSIGRHRGRPARQK